MGFVSAEAAGGERLALVIGNGGYRAAPLDQAAADARLVAAALRGAGFEVTERIDADLRAMKRAIEGFGARLDRGGAEAVGLVYFAGHGIRLRGRNFLLPVDARTRREDHLRARAIALDWMLKRIGAGGGRLRIVILDAGRGNRFADGFAIAARGLARMAPPAETLIAHAAAPGAVVPDHAGENGVYAAALARAIGIPGMALERVFKEVRITVQKATKGAQVPWVGAALTREFSFTPAAAAPRPANRLEIAWWKRIGNSGEISDYETYLKKFGANADFAALARSRIAALRARAAQSDKPAEANRLRADMAAARTAMKKAEDFIRDLEDDSSGLMSGISTKMPLSKRLDIFRGFMGAIVDFRTMARFVLGRHAKRISKAEFEEFLNYYEALFLDGYTYTRGDVWDGQIDLKQVRPYAKDYLVTVTLRPRKGGSDVVGLRIRRHPGSFFDFKVIDVLYKGVSLLVTQRADFGPVLNRAGLPGLIAEIEKKVGYQEDVIEIPD
jgi:ABC-type transporter MlaC component